MPFTPLRPIHALVEGLAALVWPPLCVACDTSVARPGFCADCLMLLEPRMGPMCIICHTDLPIDAGIAQRCGRCLAKAPAFERALAIFDYAGPAGDAVRSGKYGRRPAALPALAHLVTQHINALTGAIDTVVPIPLHPRRMAKRGHAAPQILAAPIARTLGVRSRPRWLRRIRDTPEQAGLSDRARQQNVRGAFQARPAVVGQRILLVDDVMTTGATTREAARCLVRAGAAQVIVLAACAVSRLT